MRQDETTYPKRICIKLYICYIYWKGRNYLATRWICAKTTYHTCTIGDMGALNITHPNDLPPKSYTFWLLTSHIQISWPPYHKSSKWRFRWLSHVIQVYLAGILHHRSARKKVTTMHLSKWMSSWWCYCSVRRTHCSSYDVGLHSLHKQPWRCHWILNLAAQAMDGHEGRLSRSKLYKKNFIQQV